MDCSRAKTVVRGTVQGVGFRPFVYRLATELELNGWVSNTSEGVFIEVEGDAASVQRFLFRLERETPPRASIQSLESSFLDPAGYQKFEIRPSEDAGGKTVMILPDIATCADCLRELFEPADRRFRYPFTNCTNCGPRFSIIEALPYDRKNTSMKSFTMCAECDREYHDPLDRRFHAQPNACPRCGPQLELWNSEGEVVARTTEALARGCEAIGAGQILALKGLGGFQLLVDATNQTAVARLRERKRREEKPFAVMVPSLGQAQQLCRISELEERLLLSPEAPIVLLERRMDARIAPLVAPGNPYLGLMLPYTPLHHLLMQSSLGLPVVATSGNRSDEPICIDEREVLERLRGIADLFLVHDRPIVRPMDDSIARIMAGREMVLRRARGYAPLPITCQESTHSILALGAHLKNTVALGLGRNVFIGQHIGDLETEPAFNAFVRSAADLPRLYDAPPAVIACDLHPDYLSTKHAAQFGVPVRSIQHHWAHIAACMAENEVSAPLLGVAWDGTGYGGDGTIWGGEFLLARRDGSFERVAHLRPFRLPGGDHAIKEPRRTALGLLHTASGDDLWNRQELLGAFTENELTLLRQMLHKEVQAPLTSSAGRLFDAVASLVGLRDRVSFEGQAAMELEWSATGDLHSVYPFAVEGTKPMLLDWVPMIRTILHELSAHVPRGLVAAKFHNTLSALILEVARRIGEPKVVLSGGCFQNRRLIETTINLLRAENFRPHWPQRVPPNDGGIALGQVVAAHWMIAGCSDKVSVGDETK